MGTTSSKQGPSGYNDGNNNKVRMLVKGVPSSNIQFFSSPNFLTTATTTNCDAGTSAPPPPPPPGGGGGGSDKSSQSLPLKDSESSTSTAEDDAIAKAAALASAYTNPGPYEMASQDAKRLVMVDAHDGFQCNINKQISPYMAVVHSFWLGTAMIPDGRKRTYTWLTQVADEKSLWMARIDPELMSIDGRIHRALLGGLAMGKLQLGLSPDGQNDQCVGEVDLSGLTWTANLKYGSVIGGLMYGCNFYQAITPNFSMGGEGMYITANSNMINSYQLRYTIPAPNEDGVTKDSTTDNNENASAKPVPGQPSPELPTSTIVANFNSAQGALTLNYKRIVTPNRVTLGAELTTNPFTFESSVILGAEFKWSRSKLQVTMDGNAKMQSYLETKLGKEPGQPSLHLCADLDHMKDEMKFGYGLSIDG